MSRILVIAGVSGSGKGTIRGRIMAKHPEITEPVSVTTRAPRPGEEHSTHYHFISEAEFWQMVENQELLEYAQIHSSYYGTPLKPIQEALDHGHDVMLEIDFQGIIQLQQHFPDMRVVFLVLPSREVQIERLKQRGTDAADLKIRLHTSDIELEWAEQAGIPLVVNDDLETATAEVERILLA